VIETVRSRVEPSHWTGLVTIRHSSYLWAVARLTDADLEGALCFVREGHAENGTDPFPTHLLERLRLLVGCELASYSELDRVREHVLAYHEVAAGASVPDDGPEDVFWRLVRDHPLCGAHASGRFDALKLSDFLTLRQLRRSALYNEYLRYYGVEYEIEVGIPSSMEHTRTFIFDAAVRDFGERERTLLNLLAPHLRQLHEAASVRQRAGRQLAELYGGDPNTQRGILIVGRGAAIDSATHPAQRLLSTYFTDANTGRLPVTVSQWLRQQRDQQRSPRLGAQPAPRLTVQGPTGTLTLERAEVGGTEVIMLDEQPLATARRALTAREREVLDLVSEGKRNNEIAQELWVSPSTVRKHLENIYAKLGVSTRTAAVRAHNRPVADQQLNARSTTSPLA
jgi:DNA-binding CsgD family transcriptional regulator